MSKKVRPRVSRRGFLAGTAAAGGAVTVPSIGQASAAPAAAAKRPKILLIVTDDQPKQTDWALQKTIGRLAGHRV
ncbi:twin-arginine translocation signal domain-containing protein [Streptomyces sp. H27-H1]|uniref:twin-arginine translocation signal domain-containing protein n=1 Tax=Streptomyces sp. H27-H1 TaxID=2996461 RepID=UPI00226ED82D|nr:twin-arginine translocation signal domain-containing protein [Streptomyces sp. H27-H1]MCY0926323.1 twin-arginine translocation signal domain-containing protein [Streptomyces sp. H27-H1]